MDNSVQIHVSYRGTGYSLEEIASYDELLGEVAPSKFRALALPAAGGAFDMHIVVSFMSGVVVSGITYDLIKHLGKQVVAIFRQKQKTTGYLPEIKTLKLSFKDIDAILEVDYTGTSPDAVSISEGVFEKLEQVVEEIHEHLPNLELENTRMQALIVPVKNDQEEKQAPLVKHFWKVGVDEVTTPTMNRFYDTRKRQFVETED